MDKRFLKYPTAGKMPDWETPNMPAKYYLTTQAMECTRQAKYARPGPTGFYLPSVMTVPLEGQLHRSGKALVNSL